MGKIHDALEKSSKAQELKVVSRVKANKPETPHESKQQVQLDPLLDNENTSQQLTDTPSVTRKSVKRRLKRERPAAIQSSQSSIQSGVVDPDLIAYHRPASTEAEIFKILRTNILFPKTGKPPRSIMITSAIPGDGKSFVASNLAVSIAQGVEEHVLLIDCDMRHSSIHGRFGFNDDVSGLSTYLANKNTLESLLKKTVVEKLTILPGGPAPANPSELLSSHAMKELLQETKARYSDRYILVDSPPPQLTPETTALANYIDGIILVVKYGSTPRDRVKSLMEKLGREKIIGVVMNSYRVPTTERYGDGQYRKHKR